MKRYSKKVLILILVIIISFVLFSNLSGYFIYQEKKKYNIILITFDALSANYLSIYGSDKETAPNLKNFSNQCFIFSNAISQSGSTVFSFCSIFTSRYPFTDNLSEEMFFNSSYLWKCKKNALFLPYLLQKGGYHTYGIVRIGTAGSRFGFSHGFDYFDDGNIQQACAEETFNAVAELVKSKIEEPFFLWIHNSEPHSPYFPPEKYFWMFYKNHSLPTIYSYLDFIISNSSNCSISLNWSSPWEENLINLGDNLAQVSGNVDEYTFIGKRYNITEEGLKQAKAAYFGNIRYADENFGKFLEYIKTQPFFNNTIIIISADHGESLGSHNIFDHNDLYQDIIHVPLLIHLPGQDFIRTIEEPVELVDIYPTITDILGLNLEYTIRGENLFSKNRNKSYQFSEYPWKKILINKEIKVWIEEDNIYFYNLSQDYSELNRKEMSHQEKENIFNISSLSEDIFMPQNKSEILKISKETGEKLRELGYIT